MTRPLHDWLVAFESCVRDRRPAEIVVLLSSLVVAWWLYVPVHELAHAWGCLSTGGAVTRLEISRIYGAGLLARIFPYVTVGSEYAGRRGNHAERCQLQAGPQSNGSLAGHIWRNMNHWSG